MKAYAVVGITAQIDWASRSKPVVLGYYKKKKSAAEFIAEFKKNKEWYMNWESFQIDTIEIKEK
jgi:hypothetical protein